MDNVWNVSFQNLLKQKQFRFVCFTLYFYYFFFLIFYVLDSFAGVGLKLKDSDSLAVCDSMPNKHETRLQFAKESFAELPEDEDKFEDGVD